MQTLRVPTSITEQEEVQVEVTRLLVECYFDIVRANLQASPHSSLWLISYFLVPRWSNLAHNLIVLPCLRCLWSVKSSANAELKGFVCMSYF